MKGSGQRGIQPFRQLEIIDAQQLHARLILLNLPSMRVASILALFASAEASSIESVLYHKRGSQWTGQKRQLTRCNDHGLPNGNISQDRPHVSLHLRVDSGAELIDEQIRGVSCKPGKY